MGHPTGASAPVLDDVPSGGCDVVRFRLGVPLEPGLDAGADLRHGRIQSMRCVFSEHRGPVVGLPAAFASLAQQIFSGGQLGVGGARVRVRYLNRDGDDLDALLLMPVSHDLVEPTADLE